MRPQFFRLLKMSASASILSKEGRAPIKLDKGTSESLENAEFQPWAEELIEISEDLLNRQGSNDREALLL